MVCWLFFFFFKQKTAYEMRISDWSSDVCSSDLIGCRYVLVGHSERREYHGESDELIAQKALAAKAAGLVPVVCVGETLHQRDAGQTQWALEQQLEPVFELLGNNALDDVVIAYEQNGRASCRERGVRYV